MDHIHSKIIQTQSSRQLNPSNLRFQAAVFGVLVFANAIGDIDEASLREAEFNRTRSEIPADRTQRTA